MAHPSKAKTLVAEKCYKKKNNLTLVFLWIKKKAEIKKLCSTLPDTCVSPPSASRLPYISPYSTRSKTQYLDLQPCFRRRELPPRKARTCSKILTSDICLRLGKRTYKSRKRRRQAKEREMESEVRARLKKTMTNKMNSWFYSA